MEEVIVAGAGIWGCTVARRLAEAGRRVLVLWIVRALVAVNIAACFYCFRFFDGISVPYNRVAFGFFLQNALLISLLWLSWDMSRFACKGDAKS